MADEVVQITDASFENEVVKSGTPALVDFWAEWCAPCRMVAPVVEEVARDYAGKVKVGKLNVDDNVSTAARFNVMSIPTLLFFKNGKVQDSIVGVVAKAEIQKRLDKLLASG